MQIKTPSLNQQIMYLSRGNKQKCIVARWLIRKLNLLILDEPTRGIDVGSKAEIHSLMCDMADRGMGIILISSELPEIIGMSDRIYVMYAGNISDPIERKEFSEDKIIRLALGSGV